MPALPIRATITPLSGSLGAIEFHGWKGWVGALEDDLDLFRRAGGKGYGAQTVGQEHVKTCTAWRQETNATTAETWITRLQAAKGPVVSLQDAYLRTLKRCRIRSVDFEVKSGKGGILAGSSLATILINVSLSVERLPDA